MSLKYRPGASKSISISIIHHPSAGITTQCNGGMQNPWLPYNGHTAILSQLTNIRCGSYRLDGDRSRVLWRYSKESLTKQDQNEKLSFKNHNRCPPPKIVQCVLKTSISFRFEGYKYPVQVWPTSVRNSNALIHSAVLSLVSRTRLCR